MDLFKGGRAFCAARGRGSLSVSVCLFLSAMPFCNGTQCRTTAAPGPPLVYADSKTPRAVRQFVLNLVFFWYFFLFEYEKNTKKIPLGIPPLENVPVTRPQNDAVSFRPPPPPGVQMTAGHFPWWACLQEVSPPGSCQSAKNIAILLSRFGRNPLTLENFLGTVASRPLS